MEQVSGGLVDVDEFQLFRRFVEFVDLSNVEPRVRSFLERQGDAELRSAFGDPEELVEADEDGSSYGLMTEVAALQLSKDIRQLLSATNWKAVITPEVVHQEAEHARTELVRHWLDTLSLAFDMGPVRRELRINQAFQPEDPLADNYAEWQEALEESTKAVLGNVALSGDDIPELGLQYFAAVRQHVNEAPVAIPGGLEFASSEGVVLRRIDPIES